MSDTSFKAGELLANIQSPSDLRKLNPTQLKQVSDELRQYIIDIVSVYGGHFGASLGVVELTVALHYVFNTPKDQLVWDVGHQAYGHKILTGRRDAFYTNRTHGGISGFPKRSESEYDTFGVGHASTSISAALGMARARDIQQSDAKMVAIIGDGSMTGGLAFEGLNNAGTSNSDMLVVLNDNRMSIDPNVGALNEYLADITAGKYWNNLRDDIWDFLGRMKGKGGGTMQRMVARVENGLKAALTPGGLFEALGFRYFGPVDGHDVEKLADMLTDLKALKGPILLHIMTVKGKGFAPAEADQLKWHAQSSPFDKLTGESLVKADPTKKKKPNWQDIFGDALVELAAQDEKIVGITAAMPSGTSLNKMMKAFPQRAFDIGIAEMHGVVEAAGMATQGLKPFVAIYSSFMQRAYDGVIHDVALQHLPVVFCMDRAGLVGADGPTHHGALDIAYMRCVQGMVCAAPMDEQDLRDLMFTAAAQNQAPFALRYPRGGATGMELRKGFEKIEIGKGRKLADGADVAIVSYGAIGNHVHQARELLHQEGISAAHYDLRFCKPLDEEMLTEIFQQFNTVITIEDGVVQGGAGSAILEWAADHRFKADVLRLGHPDHFVEHGTQEELYVEIGLDAAGIARQTLAFVHKAEVVS
jgi:1-deoxy-D-xylulose-5-phosphate synthase